MNGTNDLALVVYINEQIKVVVALAHRINLLALNAILLSRRAGGLAFGFGVIADELRRFSKTLMLVMQALMGLSYGTVQAVSLYQRHIRLHKIMALTGQQMTCGYFQFDVGRSQARAVQLRGELLRSYAGLRRLIVDAEDASRFGSVISKSLKIEAAYGGEFCAILSQVALDFTGLVEGIPSILHGLNAVIEDVA